MPNEEPDDTELRAMWLAYVANDREDVKLRDKLVRHYFPLVEQFVRRFQHRGGRMDRDNIESWAMAGLLRAVERYDPLPRDGYEVPVSFGMYAYRSMSSEALDGLRKEDFAPRSLRKKQRRIEAAQQEMTQRTGRSPSLAELAEEMGETKAWLSNTMAEIKNSWIDPLDTPENEEPEEVEDGTARILRDALSTEMSRLHPLEKTLVALCHYDEMSIPDAAKQIGISTAHARATYQKAVLQCHEAMLRAVGML